MCDGRARIFGRLPQEQNSWQTPSLPPATHPSLDCWTPAGKTLYLANTACPAPMFSFRPAPSDWAHSAGASPKQLLPCFILQMALVGTSATPK